MVIPTGVILLWSGAIGTIPTGFVLCDGNNGSPDLRDMFVVGAGDNYDPDDQGGEINHDHTFTGDGHSHDLQAGAFVAAGADYNTTSTSDPATGTTDETDHLPPYYALAYIMKT